MGEKLVFIENNRPITDSLTVAEVFSKRHDRVLQDIRELECSEKYRLHHFVESSYTNQPNMDRESLKANNATNLVPFPIA
jgi:Rha family phage regulatory protein